MAKAKRNVSASTGPSKKAVIERVLRSKLPHWELAAAPAIASADAVFEPDVVGAGMGQLKQKYGSKAKKPNLKKNGSLVRVKLKGSADDARSTKTALVHDGKLLGVQG